MKKIVCALVVSGSIASAHGLEIGRGMIVSQSKHMIEIFVTEERKKFGDVNATCTLMDETGKTIDTVNTQFTQNRMPLFFDGFHTGYWQVDSVSCRLSRPE